ncbi:MAG: hypothetical protein K1X83_03660 [Oligoflexia bacterium]|nr:hypothetical protein [Oligoflexia bacterium]
MTPTPEEESGPEVYSLLNTWCMYRHEGPGKMGLAGDLRAFDVRFSGEPRSEGLSVETDTTGHCKVVTPPINSPKRGDFIIFQEQGKAPPTVLQLEQIGRDPSTWLPYYVATGTIVENGLGAFSGALRDKAKRLLDGTDWI